MYKKLHYKLLYRKFNTLKKKNATLENRIRISSLHWIKRVDTKFSQMACTPGMLRTPKHGSGATFTSQLSEAGSLRFISTLLGFYALVFLIIVWSC